VVLILRKAFVADVREGSTTFLLLEHHASTSLFSNSDDDGYIIINHVKWSRARRPSVTVR
jgi:hypothetical protein